METRDVRDITRNSDQVTTTMRFRSSVPDPPEIIVCGDSELHNYTADHATQFRAFLRDGATDFEHSSAKAFAIDLVGVEPLIVGTRNNLYEGWIRPDFSSFHVGDPGYDPFEDAEPCDKDYCQMDDHVVTNYLPEQTEKTRDLFDAVLGEKVEIRWTVSTEGRDDDRE